MRGRRALLVLLLAASPVWADQTLLSNGPPDQRLDLVFLGDGYTAAELPLYAADVQRFTDALFSQPPFSTHKDLFNVHRVDVASAQSGADDACAGVSVDTALDAGYNSTGADCRLLFTYSGAKVYAAAARAPGYDPGSGLVAVLVNAAAHGGAATAGGYCVVYRGTAGPEVLAHELGHSFGLLADEYTAGGGAYPGGEPFQPNATVERNRALVKWGRWIAAATPVPTAGAALGVPGLYEGGLGFQAGVFRPTYDSKMRTLNRPYDAVNEALLVERMDALLPPTVQVLSPGAGATVSGRLDVSAVAEDGVDVARMELSSNGSLLAAAPSSGRRASAAWSLDLAGMDPGPRAVTVSAVDAAGNRTDRTFMVNVSGAAAPRAGPAPRGRSILLTPSLRDGVNDAVAFGSDAAEVSVFDGGGRLVYSAADGSSWSGAGAESGIYLCQVRRRDGREDHFTIRLAR